MSRSADAWVHVMSVCQMASQAMHVRRSQLRQMMKLSLSGEHCCSSPQFSWRQVCRRDVPQRKACKDWSSYLWNVSLSAKVLTSWYARRLPQLGLVAVLQVSLFCPTLRIIEDRAGPVEPASTRGFLPLYLIPGFVGDLMGYRLRDAAAMEVWHMVTRRCDGSSKRDDACDLFKTYYASCWRGGSHRSGDFSRF